MALGIILLHFCIFVIIFVCVETVIVTAFISIASDVSMWNVQG